MGGTHTHPQNLSPTGITKYNPCGPAVCVSVESACPVADQTADEAARHGGADAIAVLCATGHGPRRMMAQISQIRSCETDM
jgi:hypothetical protein